MSKFVLFFLVISAIVFESLNAKDSKLVPIHNYTISDGLAHNGVTSIIEDSRGYIWIATYDGINKYDGYSFKTYKNSYDEEIIISNRVRSLCEDKNGNIWIGTDEGISIYDYNFDKFYNLYPKSGKAITIRNIYASKSKNNIICGTEGDGILVFSSDYQLKTHIKPTRNETNTKEVFYSFEELDSLNYLCTTPTGLKLLNIEEESLETVLDKRLSTNSEVKVLKDRSIAVALNRGIEVMRYNIVGGEYSFEEETVLFKDKVYTSILKGRDKNLWLGMLYDGVEKIDDFQEVLSRENYSMESYSGQTLRTSCIYYSERTGCWVGTFNKGVMRFAAKKNPFHHYNWNEYRTNAIRSNSMLFVQPYSNKHILVGSHTAGLGLYNTNTGKFNNLPFSLDKKIREEVNSIFIDHQEDIWLKGPYNMGLMRLRKGKSTIEQIDKNKFTQLMDIRPRSLVEDKHGNIWIGDINGVYKITLDKERAVINVEALNDHPHFIKEPLDMVRCVYADPQYNFIWIGSQSGGLVRIKNQEGEALSNLEVTQIKRDKANPRSLSNNFVSSIIRIPTGELWIGTEGGGICNVLNSHKTPEFEVYTEKEGLSNDVIKSIIFDDDFNLWISTNIGLNKFNIKDKQFRRFRVEDGLPFDDFWYSSTKLNNGKLVFSGVEGFCYFDPSELDNEVLMPNLELEDFKIFNKKVSVGDEVNGRVLFTKRLSETNKIELKHNENSISFTLNSLHHSVPESYNLQYQMLPLNEQWLTVPSYQRNISYNDLNPGEYTFRVKASNSLNEWTDPKEIEFVVKPPFWKTVPAILLYVLMLAVIVYVVIRIIVKIQKLQHEVEIEHLEIEKINEVNTAKLRFFSNISHEIKTPITLISGPVNMLVKRFEHMSDVLGQLQIVQRQSRKISQLIDQVHDFQRSDANLLEMHYSQFNFKIFLLNLLQDFKFLAKNDEKNLLIEEITDDIYVSADKDKLEKIVNNLINNAFKYSQNGDTITIEVNVNQKNLELRVKDTGRGIAEEDLPYVFERFFQSKNKNAEYTGGSGIGLAFSMRLAKMHYGDIFVTSKIKEGSVFTLKLPVVIKGSAELQKQTEEFVLKQEQEFNEPSVENQDMDLSKIKVDNELAEATIFFAEDNTEMRQFINGILSKFWKVKAFVNGKACLDALEKEWPDLIVSDVLMPELNGFDLCKMVKSDLKTSHIPVVLLTACTSIEEQIKGLEFGADAYIKKPFNIQHLVSTCVSILNGRKQLRERYKVDMPLELQDIDKEEVASNKVFMGKLYELLESNIDNAEIDMNMIARGLYLNRTNFYKKVKAITNQTPYELVKNYRVKRAAEMLVEKRLQVNEVYQLTGFKSRAHFSKLFKEKYNVPPGKYLAEMIKKT